MTRPSRIKTEVKGEVLEIIFDHPPANAFDQQASRDLDAALTRLNDDPALRVGIVTAKSVKGEDGQRRPLFDLYRREDDGSLGVVVGSGLELEELVAAVRLER